MIANHAPVFICHVAPNRKNMVYALLVMFQHRFGNVCIDLAVDDIEQRMQSPVSIPNGKDRVVGKAIGLMDVLV